MAWSGKNDGTPGALRARGIRTNQIFVTDVPPGACLWCGGTEFVSLPPDENWPEGRPVCVTCHPPARRRRLEVER